MKTTVVILFLFFFHVVYCQDGDFRHLKISYITYGLGSNSGDTNVVFTIDGNKLKSNVYKAIPKSMVKSEKDTLGFRPHVFSDSIFYIQPTFSFLSNSSVDSIYEILKSMKTNRVSSGNFCIKSGALYELTISADSISEKQFSMFNTFDSIAFQITNIIFPYFTKNTVEFRPLDEWKLAKICEENLKNRTRDKEQLKEKEEMIIDRKKLIEEAIKNELND